MPGAQTAEDRTGVQRPAVRGPHAVGARVQTAGVPAPSPSVPKSPSTHLCGAGRGRLRRRRHRANLRFERRGDGEHPATAGVKGGRTGSWEAEGLLGNRPSAGGGEPPRGPRRRVRPVRRPRPGRPPPPTSRTRSVDPALGLSGSAGAPPLRQMAVAEKNPEVPPHVRSFRECFPLSRAIIGQCPRNTAFWVT